MKPRILVVDDEPEIIELVEFNLKQAGYAVTTAADGAEALKKVRAQKPDLIVLDVMLPEMDGFEICKALRLDAATAKVPIIMLTAKASEIDRVLGLELGADDYLTKPFSIVELLARLRAVLRRQRPQANNLVRVADLELDMVTHDARRAGEKIELTRREFALLEFLINASPKPVSKTAIVEHVWDQHFDSETNVVNVYIKMLRRKIDRAGLPPLIHTVRGVGFALREGEP